MRVHFWGTRGSISVALTASDVRRKLSDALHRAIAQGIRSDQIAGFLDAQGSAAFARTYGGHTSCVEVKIAAPEFMICDLGNGARLLGQDIMARTGGEPPTVNVFMSHLHWDHIVGFPFFAPAYRPGSRIRIHGCHEQLEHVFRLQHSAPTFPVDFSHLDAKVEFVQLTPDRWHEIAGVRVKPMRQYHSGDSYGYRFETAGKSLVYSTDSEHKIEHQAETAAFVEFFRDADLVIFDAMYSLLDASSIKEDWGHSSNVVGVELAQLARVKKLCLFHHDPAFNDEQIDSILNDAIRLEQLTRAHHPVQVLAAWDGLDLEV